MADGRAGDSQGSILAAMQALWRRWLDAAPKPVQAPAKPPAEPGNPRYDLGSEVYQALGEASLCWDPKPTGTFDAERCSGIGVRLLSTIEREMRDCEKRIWEHYEKRLQADIEERLHEVRSKTATERMDRQPKPTIAELEAILRGERAAEEADPLGHDPKATLALKTAADMGVAARLTDAQMQANGFGLCAGTAVLAVGRVFMIDVGDAPGVWLLRPIEAGGVRNPRDCITLSGLEMLQNGFPTETGARLTFDGREYEVVGRNGSSRGGIDSWTLRPVELSPG